MFCLDQLRPGPDWTIQSGPVRTEPRQVSRLAGPPGLGLGLVAGRWCSELGWQGWLDCTALCTRCLRLLAAAVSFSQWNFPIPNESNGIKKGVPKIYCSNSRAGNLRSSQNADNSFKGSQVLPGYTRLKLNFEEYILLKPFPK